MAVTLCQQPSGSREKVEADDFYLFPHHAIQGLSPSVMPPHSERSGLLCRFQWNVPKMPSYIHTQSYVSTLRLNQVKLTAEINHHTVVGLVWCSLVWYCVRDQSKGSGQAKQSLSSISLNQFLKVRSYTDLTLNISCSMSTPWTFTSKPFPKKTFSHLFQPYYYYAC